MSKINFGEIYDNYLSVFNGFVDSVMNDEYFGRVSTGSSKMLEAMSYSLKNGGKRVRPVLTMEFCRLCGGNVSEALPFALAVEKIQTYSLIHDDLPCMDDDAIRRGKPSNHMVYGYANALLVGDSLLTLAFEILAESSSSADKKAEAVCVLSRAAGFTGMIAGQVMDLDNEDREVTLDIIRNTDNLKTGEMIRAAALLGCICAGACEKQREAAVTYSDRIGLAFQITDDILDVTGDTAVLGKPVGSDDENKKSTYVSILGLDRCRDISKQLTEEAVTALDAFGEEKDFLCELAEKLIDRDR